MSHFLSFDSLLHLAAACLAALLSKEQEEELNDGYDDEGLSDSHAAEYDALGDGKAAEDAALSDGEAVTEKDLGDGEVAGKVADEEAGNEAVAAESCVDVSDSDDAGNDTAE